MTSHFWKGQVPYLARRFRVITFDARGTGRSDRPEGPALSGRDIFDALAVLDATGTERAVVAGLSLGAATALVTAAMWRDRVAGVIALASTVPALTPDHPWWDEYPFEEDPGLDEGWARFTRASWRWDFHGDRDRITPLERGLRIAELTGGELVVLATPPTAAAAPAVRAGDGPLCVAAVGGSAVGAGLLERLVAGYEAAAERVPGLQMLAVAGPRVDRERLRAPAAVEVRGYVPALDRVLAGCDVALVQGGLTTGMELVAAGRPFVSFPLKRHFEQRIHIAHRLARHGHTRALEVEDATPESVGEAIADALGAPVDYRAVAPGGAARAAARIAELL